MSRLSSASSTSRPCSAAAIDWTIPGQRIGDKPDKDFYDKNTGEFLGRGPLAPKTLRRIAAGIARYWGPIHLEATGNQYDAADPKHRNFGDPNAYYRAWPVEEYLRVLHTGETKALAIPVEGRDGKEPRPVGWPFRTQTARAETALLLRNNGIRGGHPARHATPVDEYMRTITASGPIQSLLQPPLPLHVSLMGGSDIHVRNSARPIDMELRTLTAEGNNDYLLTPYYGSSDTAKPIDQPIGTLTTRDRYALIHRHNSSKGDGAEMLTPAFETMRTLTAKGHQSVITPGDIAAAEAQIEDCLFRMLEPHEVAAGMAFPGDYRWDALDDKGKPPSRRNLVKMAGNAVTPPSARDLGGVMVEALTGEVAA